MSRTGVYPPVGDPDAVHEATPQCSWEERRTVVPHSLPGLRERASSGADELLCAPAADGASYLDDVLRSG